jgi:hypothetical protein
MAALFATHSQRHSLWNWNTGRRLSFAWRDLTKFVKTLQNGQLVTLEGTLHYREIAGERVALIQTFCLQLGNKSLPCQFLKEEHSSRSSPPSATDWFA